jgi:hypothetical protein
MAVLKPPDAANHVAGDGAGRFQIVLEAGALSTRAATRPVTLAPMMTAWCPDMVPPISSPIAQSLAAPRMQVVRMELRSG